MNICVNTTRSYFLITFDDETGQNDCGGTLKTNDELIGYKKVRFECEGQLWGESKLRAMVCFCVKMVLWLCICTLCCDATYLITNTVCTQSELHRFINKTLQQVFGISKTHTCNFGYLPRTSFLSHADFYFLQVRPRWSYNLEVCYCI